MSDEELWATLIEFLRSDLPRFSFDALDAYTQERGLPSGALIRQRLGMWRDIHKKARELLRYAVDRDGSWTWAETILDVVPGEAPRISVSREETLAALGRVAPRIEGPLTVMAYEQARRDDDPQAVLVTSRSGSWIRALLDAGLEDRLSAKARGKLARGEVDLAPLA